jgi:hypothetical protein
MNPRIACLLLLFSLASCATDALKNHPLVSVDGVVITEADKAGVIAREEADIRSKYHSDPKKRDQLLAEMNSTLFSRLINQQLMVGEFHRLKGILKPPYVVADRESFIQRNFQGDHAAFQAYLAQRGISMQQFVASQERMIIATVMWYRIAGGADTAKLRRERNEKKLKELHQQADIRTLGSW